AYEKRRNDLVEEFQGNRNPFIDDPALADRIGAEAFRRASRWDESR
ncbi:MAG: endonuclease, partial [Elusimicrobia bacterium]|nr:endonuclease [Elusimicrobiota bacterium]